MKKVIITIIIFMCLGLVAQNVAVYFDQGGSKLTVGSAGTLDIVGTFKINGTDATTPLSYLSGITAGTVTASKLVAVDASKNIGDFGNLDAVNIDLGASAVAGTLDIFPTTATSGKLTLLCADNAADYTITLTNASHGQATTYTIPDIGGATGNIVTLSASQTTAGELKRADLTEEVLQVHGIKAYDVRAADGAGLALSETAGDHFLSLSSNALFIQGEEAISETETSVSYIQYILPPGYVAAGDVKIRIKHQLDGAGTDNASTLDVEVFEQDGNGAVGADICATAAASSINGTWTTTDFTVTATALVAGDIIIIKITTACIESAGSALAFQLDGLAVLADIK